MTPTIKAVIKATYDARSLAESLQDALHHAHAVESIILLPLITQAAQIGAALKALRSAAEEDENGRAPLSKEG